MFVVKWRVNSRVIGIVIVPEDFSFLNILIAISALEQLSIRYENPFSEIDVGAINQDYSPGDSPIIPGETFVSDVLAVNQPMALEKAMNDVEVLFDCQLKERQRCKEQRNELERIGVTVEDKRICDELICE